MWIRLNEFEILIITLKTILRSFLIPCRTVLRKPCMNREDNIKISPFSYIVIVAITM